MKKLLVLTLVLAVGGVSACGYLLQRKMVGKWANKYSPTMAWDIKSDGTINVLNKDEDGRDKVVSSARYDTKGSDSFEIRWDDGSKPELIQVHFNDSGGMVLVRPGGGQAIFEKIE